jgi:hypothetical protein
MLALPNHLVFVLLVDTVVARKEEGKFIGNVDPHGVKPYAFVRDVQNDALMQQSVGSDPHIDRMVEVAAG